MVDFVPAGYPRVAPYLHVDGATEAIEFYKDALGATERMRMPGPDNKIAHCELEFGESIVMLADEFPDMHALSPKTTGGTPVSIMVYVEDVDATVERAVKAGAKVLQPIEDRFYGDRSGSIEDPWGHHWDISTHVEDVPEDEMARRMAEMNA